MSTVPARKRHLNFLTRMAIRCLQGTSTDLIDFIVQLRIANSILDITPVPNSATLKPVRLHVHRLDLLVYERRTRDAIWGRDGVNGYLIPEECTGSYELYGEWILPREVLNEIPVFRPNGCSLKMGDSAGGGLTLALLLYLKSFLVSPTAPHNPVFQLPRSATVFSPWVDVAWGMESWHRNIKTDYLPPLAPDFFHKMYSDTLNPVFYYLVGTEFPSVTTWTAPLLLSEKLWLRHAKS
ncbi:hypothetical protein BJ742DRAFT_900630 [Cladochytrium replicatum]|nr:hypothetical protein BJ742DRAFT_900630 [Cladochytrium replicatum]